MQTAPAIIEQQTLPGLVQRAASQLANATSAAEVLEARDTARVAYDAAKSAARFVKAKKAHDDLLAAVYRAQADALEIEALAKRRLADEYDAAQERGEVGQEGRPKTVPNENGIVPATAADIGLSRKDIHEAREIRDAEKAQPGIVRQTLDELIEGGQEPTRAAVRRVVHSRPAPLSPAGKQLAKLRQAWREACPAVRQHFLTEISEVEQAA